MQKIGAENYQFSSSSGPLDLPSSLFNIPCSCACECRDLKVETVAKGKVIPFGIRNSAFDILARLSQVLSLATPQKQKTRRNFPAGRGLNRFCLAARQEFPFRVGA